MCSCTNEKQDRHHRNLWYILALQTSGYIRLEACCLLGLVLCVHYSLETWQLAERAPSKWPGELHEPLCQIQECDCLKPQNESSHQLVFLKSNGKLNKNIAAQNFSKCLLSFKTALHHLLFVLSAELTPEIHQMCLWSTHTGYMFSLTNDMNDRQLESQTDEFLLH